MKKAKVITVTNQKGGTGKTTTALFLAYGLANRGQHVLLVDEDQQCDCTFSLTSGKYDHSRTSYELLLDDSLTAKQCIIPINLSIHLIPASDKLALLDVELYKAGKFQADLLKKKLAPVTGSYDYIIIDTPPSLAEAVANALGAADYLLIPTQADLYSIKGLADLAKSINDTRKNANPQLKIAGILIGRYNERTVYSQAVAGMLTKIAQQLHTRVFKTRIREAIAVKEAEHQHRSIFDYDKKGKVTKDVNNFIDELLEVIEK